MIDDYYDVDDCGPVAIKLAYADKGYRLCPGCEGEGVNLMTMRCFGGQPCETTEYCDQCDGEGQIEIEATAIPSRNKRDGWYAGWSRGLGRHIRAEYKHESLRRLPL